MEQFNPTKVITDTFHSFIPGVFPILSNTMVIAFMAHFGFSIAASTHIGNMLGAGLGCAVPLRATCRS